MTPTTEQKRATFHALHRQGCFVLPNPWDAGSARMLQGLGFKALASTSSGHAWSLGQPDGAISREMTLEHLRSLVAATDLPDRKSTRLNSSHLVISYAVFCLKKKKKTHYYESTAQH